jgi:capsular polysaccharide biosynthesis protein
MATALLSRCKSKLGRLLRGPAGREYPRMSLDGYRQWREQRGRPLEVQTLHPADRSNLPLPRNVDRPEQLPDDAGWWGYAMRDVPRRANTATCLVTLQHAMVLGYRDPDNDGDYVPAILTEDGVALDLPQIRFRPPHRRMLQNREPQRLDRATWIIERVFHNHSHWLTAHLPKLLLLRDRPELADVVLPAAEQRPATLDESLRLAGLEPDRFPTYALDRPLHVDRLTVVGSDRFRPQLLRSVAEAFDATDNVVPTKRVYVSRERATRRRLLNEAEVWRLFEARGFEKVLMEDLSFAEQVRLMNQTMVLAGPHGAGLTNMIFLPTGGHLLEMADLGFPNPNFYATAAGLGHHYWLFPAESVGDTHPLEKDLRADVDRLAETLDQMLSEVEA